MFKAVVFSRQSLQAQICTCCECLNHPTNRHDFCPQVWLFSVCIHSRVQKNSGLLKKAQPSGFFWDFIGFFGQAEKIGKIIQKLSNLKP